MISNSLVRPSVTPTTMLFTNDRVRPWSERFSRSSSGRSTNTFVSSRRTVITLGTSRESVPFGPFTVTVSPTMVMSTPDGTAMGVLPIRLMTVLSLPGSPHVAKDFAAHVAPARLTVAHQPRAGGEDGHTETTEHARHGGRLAVDPQARRGDALDATDRASAVW